MCRFSIGSSNLRMSVSRNMTADIYRRWKSRNVRWSLLDRNRKRGGSPSEALRAYAQPVHLFKDTLLHVRIKLLGIFHGNVPAQSFFGKIRAVLKIAAQSHAYHHRGTGIASRP